MSRVVLGRGAYGVTLTDDLAGYVRDLVRRVGGRVGDRLEEEAEGLAMNAQKLWPVGYRPKNLRSRDRFVTGLRVDGADVASFVRNEADYAFFVRSKKISNGKAPEHAWTKLVREPGQGRAARLAEELAVEVAQLARGERVQ